MIGEKMRERPNKKPKKSNPMQHAGKHKIPEMFTWSPSALQRCLLCQKMLTFSDFSDCFMVLNWEEKSSFHDSDCCFVMSFESTWVIILNKPVQKSCCQISILKCHTCEVERLSHLKRSAHWHRFVNNIWEKWAFCVHRRTLRSLSSSHEKWGGNQKRCIYTFVSYMSRECVQEMTGPFILYFS